MKKYTFLSLLLITSISVLFYLVDIKTLFYSIIPATPPPRPGETQSPSDKARQLDELIKKNKFTNTKNNIILITIDTARADHFGCYGNPKIDTPNIDKLAENGVLFENAISPAPITLVSHSSMFTGLYPYAHGVRDNGTFYLDNKFLTLAEILKGNGYTTAAFVSSYPLHSQFNINQGFDYYDEQFTRLHSDQKKDVMFWHGRKITEFEKPADTVTLNFLNWLTKISKDKFFTWIHYFDPHTPYDPPSKYKRKYGNKIDDLYKGEISFVDEYIGYIFRYINTLNINNNTMIIITSDHGESLGEKGYWGHGKQIYDTETKIPLIFYYPSRLPKGKVINSQVRIIDILPTILSSAKIKIPPDIHGKNLLPLMVKSEYLPVYGALSETLNPHLRNKTRSKLFSIRTNNWKIIKHVFTQEDKNKIELYNLIKDPDERNNLAGKLEALSQVYPLLEKLDIFINKSMKINKKSQIPLTKKTKKALRALGYVQ